METLRKLTRWITFKLEATRLEALIDVECPHDPLNPCVDCYDEARALRW